MFREELQRLLAEKLGGSVPADALVVGHDSNTGVSFEDVGGAVASAPWNVLKWLGSGLASEADALQRTLTDASSGASELLGVGQAQRNASFGDVAGSALAFTPMGRVSGARGATNIGSGLAHMGDDAVRRFAGDEAEKVKAFKRGVRSIRDQFADPANADEAARRAAEIGLARQAQDQMSPVEFAQRMTRELSGSRGQIRKGLVETGFPNVRAGDVVTDDGISVAAWFPQSRRFGFDPTLVNSRDYAYWVGKHEGAHAMDVSWQKPYDMNVNFLSDGMRRMLTPESYRGTGTRTVQDILRGHSPASAKYVDYADTDRELWARLTEIRHAMNERLGSGYYDRFTPKHVQNLRESLDDIPMDAPFTSQKYPMLSVYTDEMISKWLNKMPAAVVGTGAAASAMNNQ